jgi:2-keto-3-deoxy-L-rhamnonate aldolase RhmA
MVEAEMSGAPPHFLLTLWTSDPELAARADQAGVDRVGLDLETLGKRQRQRPELGTWISAHRLGQLRPVGRALSQAALFVRTNASHPRLREEVEQLLDCGVSVLMFPNFQRVGELETFLRIVDGRAKTVPLLERLAAAERIEQIVALSEIDEIHVGLNDLAIDLALKHRIGVLGTTTLARVAAIVVGAGKRLGVGGLGRARDTNLPVPSDLVYAQYPRLGASAALISRSFAANALSSEKLAEEIANLRRRMRYWYARSPEELQAAQLALEARLAALE